LIVKRKKKGNEKSGNISTQTYVYVYLYSDFVLALP